MKKVCLIIMDGWGINKKKEGNATALASTPNITKLTAEYPVTSIITSGLAAGLPEGQMGNSEVGHLTMGAGRVVYQELTRIDKAAKDGEFKINPVLGSLVDKIKSAKGSLHIMGLVSDGGVHSHINHFFAVLDALAGKGLKNIFIHAFLDGRDTPPDSGAGFIEALSSYAGKFENCAIATIGGRFYAMDRDNRWDRVQTAYRAMVEGKGAEASDAVAAVRQSYANGLTDEFVLPTIIKNSIAVERGLDGAIKDGDGVLFMNFRADRAREITRALTEEAFDGFRREKAPRLSGFACMTEYDKKLNLPVIFSPQGLTNILGEVLSRNGVRQFRVSETEKYAHVTFFFNGGREEPFANEDRLLIPSVKDVPTYDQKPEMRAMEIAAAAVEKIKSGDYSFMLMNFANGDMVGHTGILDAAIKACETVDRAVGMVVEAAKEQGWTVLITADHGNAEQMYEEGSLSPYTAHTTGPVPLILIDDAYKGASLRSGGLKDIAPTVLKLMGIAQPKEMEGLPVI